MVGQGDRVGDRRLLRGTLTGVAIAVDSTGVKQLVLEAESLVTVSVRNDGPGPVTISKDPEVTAAGADGFVVAANAEQQVSLRPGEGLFAICAAGQTASVETI